MPPKDAYKSRTEDIGDWWQFDDIKRLRHLIKKAGLDVGGSGPISARYTPIMKYMMQVSMCSL